MRGTRRIPGLRFFTRALPVITAFCTHPGAAQDAVDSTALDAWLRRQATIRTLEVTFNQVRELPSLKHPVSTPGRLSFERPGRVRWQLGDPPATTAVADGGTFTLIDHQAGTTRTLAADSPEAARFSLLGGRGFQSPEDFHAAFELVAQGVDSGIHQFTLRPKERRLRTRIPWVFLHIDPARNDLRALDIEFQDKSRIRTVFDRPTLNRPLAPSVFRPD